jgi:hypothetical protein
MPRADADARGKNPASRIYRFSCISRPELLACKTTLRGGL